MPLTSDTQISAVVDWLSVTYHGFPPRMAYWDRGKMQTRGMMGYPDVLKHTDGCLECLAPDRPSQGQHYVWSGHAIQAAVHQFGHDIREWFVLWAKHGLVTRVDLAVDVKNGSLDISGLVDEFRIKMAVCSAKTGLFVQGVGTEGDTFYVGSPKSPKRIRIYDKAKEQKMTEGEWTRIELQTRTPWADPYCQMLIKGENWEKDIPRLIKAFLDFPDNREWQIVMDTVAGADVHITREPGNTWNWLIEQAAPALARCMSERGGNTLLTQFISAVQEATHHIVAGLEDQGEEEAPF